MTEKDIISLAGRIRDARGNRALFMVAIDGRCASGKTTLAAALAEFLGGTVIHTDDFYLPPYMRTEERYSEPGGNLDRERLMTEVLQPLRMGFGAAYRPFDCKTMGFGEKLFLKAKGLFIVEGSYSCHPEMRGLYDMTIFMTTDSETQLARIKKRNGGDRLPDFISRWIPLEEKYFAAFDIEKSADAVISSK